MNERTHGRTMVDNSQEYRLKYWATRSSVRSFARTAHSWENEFLMSQNDLVRSHSGESAGRIVGQTDDRITGQYNLQ